VGTPLITDEATPKPGCKAGFFLCSVAKFNIQSRYSIESFMNVQKRCISCVSEIVQLRTELDARVNNLAWLTDAERERLGQIGSEKRRIQFLLGHYLVRHLAAYRYQNEFRDWRLQRNFAGQYVLYDDHERHLFGSISHSGRWIAAAVSDSPIGIDIESLESKQRDYLPIARHIFSSDEVKQLTQTPAHLQGQLFYTFWTLKEASAKRSGQGLRSQVTRSSSSVQADAASNADFATWSSPDFIAGITHSTDINYELYGLLAGLGNPSYWRTAQAEEGISQ
jgi:4'-phosphopantetheinyl transferase